MESSKGHTVAMVTQYMRGSYSIFGKCCVLFFSLGETKYPISLCTVYLLANQFRRIARQLIEYNSAVFLNYFSLF